jgi:hypothetical protein
MALSAGYVLLFWYAAARVAVYRDSPRIAAD